MARNTKTAAASTTELFDLNTPEGRLAARRATNKAPNTPLKATVTDEPTVEEALAAYATASDQLQEALHVPSVTRFICASVVSLLVTSGIGLLAWWGIPLLTAMAVAATGWAFIHYVVLTLGWLLAVIVGWKLGDATYCYIGHATIDRHASAITGWVRGLFSSNPAPSAA